MAMEKHMDHIYLSASGLWDNTPSQAAPTPPSPLPSRSPAPLQVKIHHHPFLKQILSQSKKLCSTFFAKINVKSSQKPSKIGLVMQILTQQRGGSAKHGWTESLNTKYFTKMSSLFSG